MFLRKNWRPVSVFIVAIAMVCVYLLQTDTLKSPIQICNIAEATPKPPPQGETAESGHWHGDAWHAEPHDTALEVVAAPVEDYRDVELEAYEASLSHFTAEERTQYDNVLRGEITRHREKYPDCQDPDAVFEDADRVARWYVKDKAYRKKRSALSEEWQKISTENDEFFDNLYLNMSEAERMAFIRNMSDAERDSMTAKMKDWRKRSDAAFKKLQRFDEEQPIEPKPRHTH